MDSGNFRDAYLRAEREKPALGFQGRRPEPTLDEARTELAQAISRVVHVVSVIEGVVIQSYAREFCYV